MNLKLSNFPLPAVGLALVAVLAVQPNRLVAANLDYTHVPADAQWLIHVDFEALSDSKLLAALAEQNPQLVQMVRGWMAQRYGIELPDQLDSITAFSRDYREYTGTVLIQAEYEPAKIESVLRKQDDYRTTEWNDQTLHTVTLSGQEEPGPSGDEEMTVVMVDADTILLASSVDNATETLQLLAGDAASLDGLDSPLLTEQAATAWIYGAAINLGNLKQHPVAMPVLAQHQRIFWSFGKQDDGTMYEEAAFLAKNDQVAQKMRDVLTGLVAFEQLWAEGIEPMQQILQNVRIKLEGNTTGIRWEGNPQQLTTAIGPIMDRLQTWQPLLMNEVGLSQLKSK